MEIAAIINERTPVWLALADLYLDTQLEDDDYKYIAGIFHKSPYSRNEIDLINKYEVAPVLAPNLFSVAGEWAGSDDNWLVQQIVDHTRDYNRIYKKSSPIMRYIYNLYWASDWKKINHFYNDLKNT